MNHIHQWVPVRWHEPNVPASWACDCGARDVRECELCDGACTYVAPTEPDPVHSPDHYRWLPVEVIEITEKFSFILGNVLKYVMRADHKGRPLEDLKKARWYLDREIAHRERLASDNSDGVK